MTTEQTSQSPFQNARLSRQPQGLFGKLVAALLSATFVVIAFMFSLVALAIVAIAGVALGAWLWWKTRQLRKVLREQPRGFNNEPDGRVFDGEAVRTDTAEASPNRLLPRN